MNDLFNILEALQHSKRKKVLSTIIEVKGSSYRKEGAMTLYMDDATQIGLLSGGCIENDMAEKAAEIIKEKNSQTIVYDMNAGDDLGFGEGSGSIYVAKNLGKVRLSH